MNRCKKRTFNRRANLVAILVAFRTVAVAAMLLATSMASAMNCIIADAPQLAFGRYAPSSSLAHDMQATFYLECAPARPGEVMNVSIRLLPNFPGGLTMRHIATGEWLRFTLYQDPGRTMPLFGDVLFSLRAPLAATTRFPVTLYGRISAGQNVAAGRYRSRLTLQVDY